MMPGSTRRSSAFTLIELAIVLAIVPLAAAGFYSLYKALNTTQLRLEDAHERRIALSGVERRWRDDIALAGEVRITDEGARVAIRRLTAQGEPYAVIYEERDGKVIRSAGKDSVPPSRSLPVTSARFTRSGRGVALRLLREEEDGFAMRKRESVIWGTPLSPGAVIIEEVRP